MIFQGITISIHVPSWGTTDIMDLCTLSLLFQSTFPRGERLIPLVTHVKSQVISIHVPSWGTTLDGWKKSCADVKFQSTFPRGERHESSDTGPLPFKFQSTFPRGERHGRGSGCTLRSYFNPRSLVGNDAPVISTTKFFEISIHVPSWGTTNFRTKKRNSSLYFNPRSLVGNDGLMLRTSSGKVYFNPRSLVGNDCKFSQIFFVFLCNKYNFSTFYYPFSLFFSVIHVTFLIFVVRILPAFYVYF